MLYAVMLQAIWCCGQLLPASNVQQLCAAFEGRSSGDEIPMKGRSFASKVFPQMVPTVAEEDLEAVEEGGEESGTSSFVVDPDGCDYWRCVGFGQVHVMYVSQTGKVYRNLFNVVDYHRHVEYRYKEKKFSPVERRCLQEEKIPVTALLHNIFLSGLVTPSNKEDLHAYNFSAKCEYLCKKAPFYSTLLKNFFTCFFPRYFSEIAEAVDGYPTFTKEDCENFYPKGKTRKWELVSAERVAQELKQGPGRQQDAIFIEISEWDFAIMGTLRSYRRKGFGGVISCVGHGFNSRKARECFLDRWSVHLHKQNIIAGLLKMAKERGENVFVECEEPGVGV